MPLDRGFGMIISLTEFKSGIDHYLDAIDKDGIVITKDGRSIAQLTQPPRDKLAIIESLCGIVPASANERDAREERLARHEAGL